MKELKYLNKYLYKYRKNLGKGLLFVFISNVFHIIPAQMVRRALDLVVDNVTLYLSFEKLSFQSIFFEKFVYGVLFYALLILLMAVMKGVFLYMVRQTLIVTSRLIEYDLKNEIFNHYQILSTAFYSRNSTGDLMNRISEDVSRVRMYLGPSIMYGLQLVSLFAMLIPIMYSISPTLTWYSLVPLPFLSFSIYIVNNFIEQKAERIQRHQSKLSSFVQETFSGIRILKSFNREQESISNFFSKSDHYKAESLKLTRVQALFFPLITGLIGLSSVLVVYAGSYKVIEGSLSFGMIAEFIIYVNLLTWPVASLGWISSLVQRAEVSQKRINEFLNTSPDIISNVGISRTVCGDITFKNVSLTYPNTGIRALDDISFTVEAGNSLAVIGPTGSGKSTITNLLARLYDCSEGEVLIDGISITRYHLSNLRKQMGFVPQDVFLFSDTIYNNIALGGVMDDEKVKKVAREADVYDSIVGFSKGFMSHVGERGVMLSGGQKQRISIARAIYEHPRILVFDDSLSAVDTKTENTILKNMQKIMKGKTSIVISHRVSSAQFVDSIIVLDNGRIIEKGTHEQLLRKGGMYQRLYHKQLENHNGEE